MVLGIKWYLPQVVIIRIFFITESNISFEMSGLDMRKALSNYNASGIYADTHGS